MDSNHRSETQQIYSLPPLATREPPVKNGAGDGTRTRNLLITNQRSYAKKSVALTKILR